MSRQEEAFQQIRSQSFTYSETEWEAICQALHPYQWADEQHQSECRRKLERCSVAYLMGVNTVTYGKRYKAETERLNQLARQLNEAAGTLSGLESPRLYKEGFDLYREREGHLDWLRKLADSARSTAFHYQAWTPAPDRAYPTRNSIAIDMYWRYALLFYTERGLKVDQSRGVINYLASCAVPFAGESVATLYAARRFLRAIAPEWHRVFPPFSECHLPGPWLIDQT